MLFSLVPKLISADRIFRPSRQFYVVLEAEKLVYVIQKGQTFADLLADLVRSAEDVSIVLLKPSYTS